MIGHASVVCSNTGNNCHIIVPFIVELIGTLLHGGRDFLHGPLWLSAHCNMMENIGVLVVHDFHYLMIGVGHTALEQLCMGCYCLFDWKIKGQLLEWRSEVLLFQSRPCILDVTGSQSPHLMTFFNNWCVQTDVSLYTYRDLDALLQGKKKL